MEHHIVQLRTHSSMKKCNFLLMLVDLVNLACGTKTTTRGSKITNCWGTDNAIPTVFAMEIYLHQIYDYRRIYGKQSG